MPYIEFKNVVIKNYKMGEVSIKALDKTNFTIEKRRISCNSWTKWSRKNYSFKHTSEVWIVPLLEA